MSKVVSLDIFNMLFPGNKTAALIQAVFVKYFTQYEINTTNRRAGFLAQCAHESNNFTIKEENLNYSSDGLLKVFPKYFTNKGISDSYAKQPEKIANRVYANRMGNGNETSGDGYKYRGRGYIQLTGKDNYSAFAKFKNITLDECVNYLSTIEGAVESALWYWNTHNLNKYCDNDDILGMTKAINGGTIGLDDRTAKYNKFKAVLNS